MLDVAGGGIRRLIRASMAVVLGLSAALAVSAPAARADGDPASDYLLSNQVFLSAQSGTPSSSQRQLEAVVSAANRDGFRIKVAVIPSEYDLGSITELWHKPGLYARFLGLELSQTDTQRLLVVMPNGFGFNWPGHSPASTDHLLGAIAIHPGDSDLSRAAQTAVRDLAAAAGVRLPAAPLQQPPASHAAAARSTGTGVPLILVAGAAAAVLILAALVGVALLRRRRLAPAPPLAPAQPPAFARASKAAITRRWAVPGIAALLGVAIAVPIVLLIGFRHSTATDVATGAIVTPPLYSWPAGRRLAPDFALQDQDGRPVSIAAFRGRPVIVTFVDPLCRNLCPLEAHTLNYVVGRMPVAQRPEIIAVSVDVYADTRADLLQDERRWELVPQWHWAVGSPAALAAVWKRYEVGVAVVTKRLAGVALRYITHSEAAFVIDATGHQRALFLWPFYPQDLQRTLDQLR